MKKKQASSTLRGKGSLSKDVEQGGSDLEARESPKPTLSTNRIQKSKSGSCGLLPNLDLHSDTRLTHIMASSRQTSEGVQQSIEQLASRWHLLSSEQLTSLQHLCSYAQSMVQQQSSLKVKFLVALSNRHTIGRKLQDAKTNLEYLRLLDEKKIPFDHNKMLVLDILCQKLRKKYFFCQLRFRHLLSKFKIENEMTGMGQPKESYTYFSSQSKVAAANLLIGRIANIHHQKINVAFEQIKQAVYYGQVEQQSGADSLQLQPREQPSEYQVQPEPLRPQSRLPSQALELTLSPNYNISDRNFIHGHTERNSAQRDSIEHVIRLISGLKFDLKATLSRFREDRSTKTKQTYFSMWKIKFLIRHLEARLTEHYQLNFKKTVFESWKATKQVRSLQGPTKQQYLKQIQLIKASRIRRCLKFFKEYTRHRKDMNKIDDICQMIYLKNLKTKALYALARSRLWDDSRQEQITQQYIVYDESQQQTPQYVDQVQSQQSVRSLEGSVQSPISDSAAHVFYSNNLITRIFKQFKYISRFNRAFRSLNRMMNSYVWNKIYQESRHEERLAEKVNRYISKNVRYSLFRCFAALKKNIQGRLANMDSIAYLVERKKRERANKYFSVLKIMWKMKKIKLRKAEKLHQYHLSIGHFRKWQQFAADSMDIKQKQGRLLSSIYERSSIVLIRNLIRGYLKSTQLNNKAKQLQYWLFDRNKQQICDMLERWRKKTARSRNFRMVVHRFRKLRDRQQKGRIFGKWYDLTFQDDEPVAQIGQPSNEHRYWLQRYYQRLLTK